MLKEELIQENKKLKEEYEILYNDYEKLKTELINLEGIKEVNIQLQVDNAILKKQNNDYNKTIMMLQDKIETYEKVFNILEKVD